LLDRGLIHHFIDVGRLKCTYELQQRTVLHGMSAGQDLRDTSLGNTQALCELSLGATAHRMGESFDFGGTNSVVVVCGVWQCRGGL
jgi:hypothetical protein